MRESSWFNLRAGRARLVEIEREVAELERERALLKSLLAGAGALPKASSRRGRRRSSGPTLATLLAAIIKAGPRAKAWTAGEADAEARKSKFGSGWA